MLDEVVGDVVLVGEGMGGDLPLCGEYAGGLVDLASVLSREKPTAPS